MILLFVGNQYKSAGKIEIVTAANMKFDTLVMVELYRRFPGQIAQVPVEKRRI
jgi:hypothetical protein